MRATATTSPPARTSARAAGGASPRSRRRAQHRIALVDDHPLMRAGLAQLIASQPDMVVCFEAESPIAVIPLIARHRPDLLVTDLTMPQGSGLDLLKEIKADHPKQRVLVYSMHDETIYAERVLRSGADGYVMKSQGPEPLLTAIRRILNGQTFLSEHVWSQLVTSMRGRRRPQPASPIENLTDREFGVLELIGHGKSTREIAAVLQISPKTVDVHRARLREKLNLPTATALMRYAIRWTEVLPA